MSEDDRRSRKLFIGGVSFSTNDEDFFQYFAKFGELEDCVLIREKDTGQSRGFGFVTYKDRKVSEDVAQQQLYLDGRRLDPKPSISRYNMDQIHEHRNQTTKVFVGGLHDDASEAELSEHFRAFGDVLEVNIMYDRFTNAPRGFGFVTFKDADVASKVINYEHDHIIHGKKVDCKPATARKDAFKRDHHVNHAPDPYHREIHKTEKKPTSREERWRKYHGDTAAHSHRAPDPYRRGDPHHRTHPEYKHDARYPPPSYGHTAAHSHYPQPTHSNGSYPSHGYPAHSHSSHYPSSTYPAPPTSGPPHSTYPPPPNTQYPSHYAPPTATQAHSHYAAPPPHTQQSHDSQQAHVPPTAPPTNYDYSRYDPYYRPDSRYPHYPPPQTQQVPPPSGPATSNTSTSTTNTASTTAKQPTSKPPEVAAVATSSTATSNVNATNAKQPPPPTTYDYARYNPYSYAYDPNTGAAPGAQGRYNYYSQYGHIPAPQNGQSGAVKPDRNERDKVGVSGSVKVPKIAPPTKVANNNQQTPVPTTYGASRGSAATNSAQTARYSAY